MKIKVPTFADLFAETSPQLGGARRTKFLETLDRIIPWQDLKSLIGPYYSEGKIYLQKPHRSWAVPEEQSSWRL